MTFDPSQSLIPERRAHERIDVTLLGRCLLENKLEIPCQAVNISPADVAVIAAYSPRIGEHVIIYLDHVGRVDGKVVRLMKGGFAILINGTPRRREKLAASIEWLKAHLHFGAENNRRHERIEPDNRNSEIRLSDGRAYPTAVIDISLSGAALTCEVKPALGTSVSFAGMQGKVVRHFAEGIAIEFADVHTQETIADKFG